MTDAPKPKTLRSPGHRLAAAPEWLETLRRAGLSEASGFDAALRSAREQPAGRGPQRIVDLPGAAAPLRLRECRRGGALRGLLPNRFASPRRFERELALWLGLRARGAPLPVPVGAFARRRGLLWECHLGTLDRSTSPDGLAWLQTSPTRARREAVAAALGDALRRFHDAGALHGDLHLRNILVEPAASGLRCLFVDLASARATRGPSARERVRDALRLERSLAKQGFRAVLDVRLRARFLSAYCRGDRRLRAALRAAAPKRELRFVRHRLAWRLARLRARSVLAATLFLALGCARIELAGRAPDGRLEVSRSSVPPRPWIANPLGHSLAAHFPVGRSARAASRAPGRDGSRPGP